MKRLLNGAVIVLAIFVLTSMARQTKMIPLRNYHALELAPHDVFGRMEINNRNTLTTAMWEDVEFVCADLLLSRIWASYSITKAKLISQDAYGCDRFPEVQTIWLGNLEWLDGNPEAAVAIWSQLPDTHLLLYARNLVISGEDNAGLTIAGILEARAAKWLDSGNSDALSSLAEIYRLAGLESLSLPHLVAAWELGNRSYYQAFYLGRLLHQENRCEDAIRVLEEGQSTKTDELLPNLDFQYFLTLGECYSETNANNDALHAFQIAREIVHLTRGQMTEREYIRRIGILDNAERDLGPDRER